MRLITNYTSIPQAASVAQVSFSDSGGFGAVSSSETRGMPLFAPRGIAYRPCEGDRLLIMQADGAETCVGCLSLCDGIEGGELRLTSAGGASILLKNNGEISLNGLTITKDGRLSDAAGR